MAIYGTEINDDELVQYMDELAQETIIPVEDLVNASGPLKEEIKAADYNTDNIINSGIPSNIPTKIDRLFKIRNPRVILPDTTANEINELLLLKNTMSKNLIINGDYNGICVDLDTTNYNLIVEPGSTIVAL